MKRNQLNFGAWLASLAGASLGAALMNPARWITEESLGVLKCLWSGAFFAVVYLGGFLGLQIALSASRRYRIQRPQGWIAAAALAFAALFAAGCLGQLAFFWNWGATKLPPQIDIALLLDASGSMRDNNFETLRTEAASQFIDGLSQNCRIQAIAFQETDSQLALSGEFTTLDDDGKEALAAFFTTIQSNNGTNYSVPLLTAKRLLDEAKQSRSETELRNYHQAVILLTDGLCSLPESDPAWNLYAPGLSVQNGVGVQPIKFQPLSAANSAAPDDSFNLYTVRLNPQSDNEDLVRLAEGSGGKDFPIRPDANGHVDASQLVTAFQDAYQNIAEPYFVTDALLIAATEISVYQLIVRLFTLALCAALIGIGYFGRFQPFTFALNVLLSIALTAALGFATPLPVNRYALCAALFCILSGAAIVILQVNGAVSADETSSPWEAPPEPESASAESPE